MSFFGELRPLMLRDIREVGLLIPVIFVVRSGIVFVCLSSFVFVERLLSCVFYGLASLLVLVFSLYCPL